MAAYSYHLFPLFLLFIMLFLIPYTHSHNITAILDAFPDYSLYNTFLSQTKVSDEINSHEKVTCLVLSNSVMPALADRHSLPAIKNALRLLTLLKYFDPQRPHYLPGGTTVSTTLYQNTGNAPGTRGYIRITYRRGGPVAFALARPRSPFLATYTKSVQQIPYSLSVLEVSAPITFPGLLDDPPVPSNLTAFLENAGCKIFASLITSSGALEMYQSVMSNGFTLFAPNDEAFEADGAPDFSTLSRTDLVTVLQYHALPSYTPKASLQTVWGPIATMASSGSGMYNLSVTSNGDDVSLNTGLGTAHVTSTLLDYTPVCVIIIDSLLLPRELSSAAPVPSPLGFLDLAPILAPSVSLPPAADSPDISSPQKTPPYHRPLPPAADSPDISNPQKTPPYHRPHRSPRRHPPPAYRPPPPPSPDTPDTPDVPDVPDVPGVPDAPPPDKNGASNISVADTTSWATVAAFVMLFLMRQ